MQWVRARWVQEGRYHNGCERHQFWLSRKHCFFCSTRMFLYSSHRDTGFGAGAHAVFCMRVRLSEGLRVWNDNRRFVRLSVGHKIGNFMSLLRFCFHVSRIAASFFTMQCFVLLLVSTLFIEDKSCRHKSHNHDIGCSLFSLSMLLHYLF